MTTSENIGKRFTTCYIRWNWEEGIYERKETVTWQNSLLEFDTYEGFTKFISSLNEEEKLSFGVWMLIDTVTENSLIVLRGDFDKVNSISANIPGAF